MKIKMLVALVIVALACYSGRVTMTLLKEKEKSVNLEKTIDNLGQEAERYKVRLNDSVTLNAARTEALNMTINNIKRRYESLLKASSVKADDVSNVVSSETVVHEIREVPVYVDSFGGLNVECNDDFVRIKVEIDSVKKATVDYSVRDSITVINYQKRHSLLFGLIKWRENARTVVVNHNPKAVVSSVTSINRLE